VAKLLDVDPENSPETAAAFKRLQESRGWVSNLMRSIAHAPDGLNRFQALGHYARYDAQLTEAQKELVICATVRNVAYGWEHHAPLARNCGVTEAQLQTIKKGEVPGDLTAPDQAAVRYTLAFSSFKGVSRETTDEALRYFSERQIVDMSLISAFYLAAGSLIIGLEVELEGHDALKSEQEWQKKQLANAK
jgi:4-carboxymuconolactone decarboxylase